VEVGSSLSTLEWCLLSIRWRNMIMTLRIRSLKKRPAWCCLVHVSLSFNSFLDPEKQRRCITSKGMLPFIEHYDQLFQQPWPFWMQLWELPKKITSVLLHCISDFTSKWTWSSMRIYVHNCSQCSGSQISNNCTSKLGFGRYMSVFTGSPLYVGPTRMECPLPTVQKQK
jgi:hypothetical protein